MPAINIGEVSKGTKLIFDNAPWLVLEVNYVKPGKGNAFYKMRVQNLLTRYTLEKTLRGGEKVEGADVTDTEIDVYKRQRPRRTCPARCGCNCPGTRRAGRSDGAGDRRSP